MSLDIYNQILALYNEKKDIERGRKFEILVREILPWDKKPPIVMSPKTEQLDGVFVYKNTIYIIECKAKKRAITGGSPDWDDYANKIIRREGKNVIGIFCSLGKVNKDTINESKILNHRGFPNFIVAGDDWRDLQNQQVDFGALIDYMKLSIHIHFEPKIDLKKFLKWNYDKQQISSYFNSISQKYSAFFLRRFKHQFHEKIYVKRSFEKQVENYINLLKPEVLKNKISKETIQVLILSDTSGSGKTTFSINKTLDYDFCFACTAENEELDKFFEDFITKIQYPNFGIKELEAINKPLVFLVDSLDEVPISKMQYKHKEIKSLFEKLEELNEKASSFNFSAFPLLIIFTVREDYIRDWESVFEGRRNKQILHNKISSFTSNELKEALKKYFSTYDYQIKNELSEDAKMTLSIPVNLEIFSDAYRFERDIVIDDIWEGKILANYFSRKQDFIYKHHVENLTKDVYIDLLSLLAYKLILIKDRNFSKKHFYDIIEDNYLALKPQRERILDLLLSEQIIFKNVTGTYNFRYNRFIEYLVAYRIIKEIDNNEYINKIDDFIKDIMDSVILSTYNVLKNIKYIAETLFPIIGKDIYDYYSKANIYLRERLPLLRYKIAKGEKTAVEEIHTLISNTYTQDKNILWDTFFILAAKNNRQSIENILEAFSVAWDVNKSCKERRWKILIKLSDLNLILQESILIKLLNDSIAKDWETYFGLIIEKNIRLQFLNLLDQIGCLNTINEIFDRDKANYCYADELLTIIISNRKYIPGDVLNGIETDDEYIILNQVENNDSQLSENSKQIIEQILLEFRDSISKENKSLNISSYDLNQLNASDHIILNQKLEAFNKIGYGEEEKPFINFLFRNNLLYSHILHGIIWKKENFNFDVTLVDKDNITCFQDIINSEINELDNLFLYLEYIFISGYKRNKIDDKYLESIKTKKHLNLSVQNNLLIGKLYYRLNNIEHIKSIGKLNRIICTLLSIYYRRPIGFGFSNLIQVVNNALEHYSTFGELIVRAVEVNQLTEEYQKKKSYNTKVKKMRDNGIQENQYQDLFIELFPDLF